MGGSCGHEERSPLLSNARCERPLGPLTNVCTCAAHPMLQILPGDAMQRSQTAWGVVGGAALPEYPVMLIPQCAHCPPFGCRHPSELACLSVGWGACALVEPEPGWIGRVPGGAPSAECAPLSKQVMHAAHLSPPVPTADSAGNPDTYKWGQQLDGTGRGWGGVPVGEWVSQLGVDHVEGRSTPAGSIAKRL